MFSRPASSIPSRAGFSRAAFNFDSPLLTDFPSNLNFVTGNGGPGGIVIGGGVTTTGASAITSAGPNNAANVWNRRNLFTYQDDLQITKGKHQISAGVWFQRVQDNEDTASRQLGQASFTSLTTFLQGTTSSFQVVPDPTELGWRSFFGAWYIEDDIRLRRNLTLRVGLRDEFTTGWNEAQDRAANYIPIPPACCKPRRSSAIPSSPEQRDAPVRPARRPRLGSFSATARPPSAPASASIIR